MVDVTSNKVRCACPKAAERNLKSGDLGYEYINPDKAPHKLGGEPFCNRECYREALAKAGLAPTPDLPP